MIDRNYAPEGYIAVPFGIKYKSTCNQCTHQEMCKDGMYPNESCVASKRMDNEDVRFARRPTVILNTTGKPPKPPEWAKEQRIWFRTSHGTLDCLKWSPAGLHVDDYELHAWLPTIATEYR